MADHQEEEVDSLVLRMDKESDCKHLLLNQLFAIGAPKNSRRQTPHHMEYHLEDGPP